MLFFLMDMQEILNDNTDMHLFKLNCHVGFTIIVLVNKYQNYILWALEKFYNNYRQHNFMLIYI